MHTITETDLVRAAQYKAIKRIRIEETPDSKYRTHITIMKEDHEQTLITQRKAPREWASLDRLVKHIRNSYGVIPSITLSLHYNQEQHQ